MTPFTTNSCQVAFVKTNHCEEKQGWLFKHDPFFVVAYRARAFVSTWDMLRRSLPTGLNFTRDRAGTACRYRLREAKSIVGSEIPYVILK